MNLQELKDAIERAAEIASEKHMVTKVKCQIYDGPEHCRQSISVDLEFHPKDDL